ncbi:MAG: C10 family peptidase [Bacteroidales bacterium]|nr:C10 family peptidase [Bacteroidales bacterium]
MTRFILSLFVLLALPVYAQQVSVETARQVAKNFVMNQLNGAGLKSVTISSPELVYTAEQDGNNHFYVFNVGNDQRGFVIVGADEAAEEIIGYSTNGGFEYDKAPENFKWWLSQYSAQIRSGIELGVKAREKAANKSARVSVTPLLNTQWNQKEPYNNAIPTVTLGSAKKCVTGCGATAVAQIMKYYEYPSSVGQGQKSYTMYYKNNSPSQGYFEYSKEPIAGYTSETTFSADFGNTHYDWDNMLNNYGSGYNAQEADAVATLMYHVGVAMDMEYTPSESSSSERTAVSALSAHFGYDKSAKYVSRDYYTDVAWEDMIYEEIVAHRPVLYGGQSGDSGHLFVCDGYDANAAKNAYHINWGWGGYCDGYYALTGSPALDPAGSGIGGAGNGASYTDSQGAVVNIKPDEGGDYEYVINWNDASVANSEVQRGENFLFGGQIVNHSAVSATMEIGAKFIRKTDNQTYYVSIGKIESLSSWMLRNLSSYAIATGSVPEGSYYVKLVFKSAGDGWREANTNIVPEVEITTSDKEYIITSQLIAGDGEYVLADINAFSVRFKVKNNTSSALTKTFQSLVYVNTSGSNYDGAFRLKKTVTIPANTEIEVVLSDRTSTWKSVMEAGKKYWINLEEGGNELVSKYIVTAVETMPTGIGQVFGDEDVRIEAIYTIDGKRINSLQKGINIVRMSNGRVEKVVVR